MSVFHTHLNVQLCGSVIATQPFVLAPVRHFALVVLLVAQCALMIGQQLQQYIGHLQGGQHVALLVHRERQIFQNIRACREHRFRRTGCIVRRQPIHCLAHPQRRVIIVLVQIRLSAHFEAIVCRHFRAVLYTIQLTARNAGRLQFVRVLQAHQSDGGPVEILVGWEFELIAVIGIVL